MALDTEVLSERMSAIEAVLLDVRQVLNTLRDITMSVVGVMEELASGQAQAEIDALAERAQAVLEHLNTDKDLIVLSNAELNTEAIKVDPTP